ncbi:MAG: ATP-dependent zinc metalloprotease FtsH [Acidobacteria bacterium]|nr:ATP-dependent zinc metalloprotease FtsH [Acidobacteriota bacterium]
MENFSKKLPSKKIGISILYLIGVYAVLIIANQVLLGPHPKKIEYSEFINLVRQDKVVEVKVSSAEIWAKLNEPFGKEATKGLFNQRRAAPPNEVYVVRLPGIDETPILHKELDLHKVRYYGYIEDEMWKAFLGWLLPIGILALVYIFGIRRITQQAGGALTFGKNRAKIFDKSSSDKATFQDVAGVDEAVAELREIVDFLKTPAKYQRLGGRIPRGVLMVGPPGTGKTLLGRAVAGEADVPFFSISGSEFVELFVGVGASRVRDLFEQAKAKAPCIIFIDELDAIGKSRMSGLAGMAGHDEREQTLNQILVEMDGFDTSKGVIIMAATNRPEILDQALLRAGRFDRQVVVDRPDLLGREAILQVHCKKIQLNRDLDLKVIAARTSGLVGADLANIVNESALLAARRGRSDATGVTLADFEEAIDRIMLGLEKKSRVLGQREKEIVAFHEVGHTLVAMTVKNADPVHRVTIIPRGVSALGATLQLPTEDRFLLTKAQLEDRLAVLLGGRVAEELVFQEVSTGAQNDLERASEIARQMVCRFGMSPRLGLLTYGHPASGPFLQNPFGLEPKNFSEHTAEIIDDEVRRIMDDAHQRVRQILNSRRRTMQNIATELIACETLDREKLERLVTEESHSEPVPCVAAPHDLGSPSSLDS